MTNHHTCSLSSSSPSFSSVPDEIVVNCLARISKSQYGSLCLVSKNFYSLLSSPEIYTVRFQIGATEPRLYVCLSLSVPTHRHRWFTLTKNSPDELSFQPVRFPPSSSDYCYARLNSTIVVFGSEIYEIGGSNKDKRSRHIRVLDCRSHTWRTCPNMLVARKRAKSWFLDGTIYVIGGCRKREEAMNWGEVFDLKTQTWSPLPSPSHDGIGSRQVLVLGGKLYVITKDNKYVYDLKQERWVLEFGFRGLELVRNGPWCVIENLVFLEYLDKYWWYDLSSGTWFMVEGLGDLPLNRTYYNRTLQLVNYGGKLLIIWREWIEMMHSRGHPLGILDKRTYCAVIRLEKRLTSLGTQIWGEFERLNHVVIRLPKSYNKLLSCVSVSV